MPGKLDPTNMANNWKTKFAASGDNIKAGVQAMTETPGAVAARNPDKYLAGVNESVSSGRYAEGNTGYSLGWFQKRVIDVGIPRLQSGATKGQEAYLEYARQAAPVLAEIKAEVRSMPNNTEQERDARMLHQVARMRKFKFNKTRRA